MTDAEKILVWFLRFTAIVLISAAGAVFMPYATMNAVHEFLGLGTLPDHPLIGYLTRSLSALYALVGGGCWHVSRDLRRYLPLLRFFVPMTFGFSLALIGIDVAVDMPIWWTAVEGIYLSGWTLVFWRLVSSASKQGDHTVHGRE